MASESFSGPASVPLFSSVPEATACGKATSWNASDGHYGQGPTNPPEIDIVELGVAQCGDLSFSGQSGRWTGFYDFSVAHPGEWSTWKRLTRDRRTGTYSDSVAQHAQIDSADIDIPFVLDPRFDLVGLQHHIKRGSALPSINEQVEAWAQIWRRIGKPVVQSVNVSHDTVTIVFQNNSQQRAIDSTLVEHFPPGGSSWVPRGSVGGQATTFIDTPVPPGSYTYRLKHVTEGIVSGFEPPPPRPNSGWVETPVTVPGFAPPTQFYCDDTLEPTALCFWQNSTDTAAVQIERDGAVVDTVAAGGSSWQDNSVVSGTSYAYRIRHLSLTHQTVSDWTGWTLAVQPTAPQNFTCTSSDGFVGCGWGLGEANDTTELQRQRQGSSRWSFLVKVAPGVTNYQDLNVGLGETWCYRARHRRRAVTTAWAGPACVVVQSGPGPIPGRPGRQ